MKETKNKVIAVVPEAALEDYDASWGPGVKIVNWEKAGKILSAQLAEKANQISKELGK